MAQEVALSYAPAFWVICFYLSFLKKEKKKRKKVSPSPLPSPPPLKLPAESKFFQNPSPHCDRKVPPSLLSLLPCCGGQSLAGGQERGCGTSRAGERVLEVEGKV